MMIVELNNQVDDTKNIVIPGTEAFWCSVENIEEAAVVVKAYIKKHELQENQWIGGQVVNENGYLVGMIIFAGEVKTESNEKFVLFPTFVKSVIGNEELFVPISTSTYEN